MNIFGIGGTEIAIIVLIMLVVAGPKRMLQWAYLFGKFSAQLRVMWRDVMGNIQKELDDAGMDVKLPKEMPTRQNINKLASDVLRPVQEPIEKVAKEYEAEFKNMESSMKIEAPNGNGRPQKKNTPDDDSSTQNGSSFGTWSGAGQSSDEE